MLTLKAQDESLTKTSHIIFSCNFIFKVLVPFVVVSQESKTQFNICFSFSNRVNGVPNMNESSFSLSPHSGVKIAIPLKLSDYKPNHGICAISEA